MKGFHIPFLATRPVALESVDGFPLRIMPRGKP